MKAGSAKTEKSGPRATSSVEGTPVDVGRKLLEAGISEEVLALITTLTARNEELEKLLAQLLGRRNRSEKISAAQLDMFLDKLRQQSEQVVAKADEKLANESSNKAPKPETTPPPKQPPVRRPAPESLPRVDNVIAFQSPSGRARSVAVSVVAFITKPPRSSI